MSDTNRNYEANVGHQLLAKRTAISRIHNSVGTQLRLFHRLDGSPLTLTIGIGGDVKVTAAGWHHADPVEGLLLMRAGWNLTRRLSLEASWYRSFTHDDHDLDIITGGLGWRFGTR